MEEFLLKVGEGDITEGSDGVILPNTVHRASSISDLVQNVYDDISSETLSGTAILTPLNEDVQLINDAVLNEFVGEDRLFQSVDVIPPGEVDNLSLYPTEFLNSINVAQLLLHKLRLKIGCIVILL